VTKNDFEFLLENGFIDFRYIDNEVKFQERFHYNIAFTDEKYRSKMNTNKIRQSVDKLLRDTILEIIESKSIEKYYVRAKISIRRRDPKNKNVSVWLPLPLEEFQQQDVKILSSSHKYLLSNSKDQNTVYMEGEDINTFWIEFSYVISNIVREKAKFDNPVINDDLSEKSPHILFTPYLKGISDTILKDTDKSNDFEVAKKLYDFLTFEVDYSYVLPYAMYDNIPEYLMTTFKGDCGFQALTFITLCRMNNIPAKWQSGWFITPNYASPHDWTLIYLKEFGWIPVDLSFGNHNKNNEKLRSFYFGNLDHFRMFANLKFQSDLFPKKKYFRNDPYDNQLGEMGTNDNYIIDTESKIEVLEFKKL
jgi:hypothetical protein